MISAAAGVLTMAASATAARMVFMGVRRGAPRRTTPNLYKSLKNFILSPNP